MVDFEFGDNWIDSISEIADFVSFCFDGIDIFVDEFSRQLAKGMLESGEFLGILSDWFLQIQWLKLGMSAGHVKYLKA